MKKTINYILNKFNEDKECLQMDFKNDNWRKKIPAEPGWYFINTNTPVKIFKSLGKPIGINHYKIMRRVNKVLSIYNDEILIKQNNGELYTVYSGETADLKARAREHDHGSNTTYCLSLGQYEVFHNYEWYFCFLPISYLGNNYKDDKILRVMVEQVFRARYGWPIICKG